MAILTIRQTKKRFGLPHRILINGRMLGVMNTPEINIQLPPGQYQVEIQSLFPFINSLKFLTVSEETSNVLEFRDKEKWWDRPQFGAHLDVVNMITTPERYFFNDRFLEECFRKLDGRICSCHLKDIRLKQEYTFQLEECACGEGTLDIELYARLASAQNPCMPMIIEHLDTDSQYIESVRYVQRRLA